MELAERVRGVWPLLLAAALVLVVGAFFLRRAGILAESVTLMAAATLRGDEQMDEGAPGRSVRLVTLLPKDGIAAIFDPDFVSAAEAGSQLDDEDLVIGVSMGGEHRAYGVAHLLPTDRVLRAAHGGAVSASL
ncbi:MAG: DUF3179 domain-containing (seleno)protein [Chloroflexi bacterium]|nr:DUF3179 domain-containing (seleno)protein [Chloroflexota bacterium]